MYETDKYYLYEILGTNRILYLVAHNKHEATYLLSLSKYKKYLQIGQKITSDCAYVPAGRTVEQQIQLLDDAFDSNQLTIIAKNDI